MLNLLMSLILVDEAKAVAKEQADFEKNRALKGVKEITLNPKEAAKLLEILEEELSGKMYDRIYVMQSQFGRFNSWFWKRDTEWMFTWGDALRLRAYLAYKLNKGIDKEFTVHTDTLSKMPVYRKVN
jgi:hypothetical protein